MVRQQRSRRSGAARVLVAGAVVLAVVAGAALLTACGGSSGSASAGSAASASARPTPVPSPVITSGEPPAAAVDAVREYWKLVGEGSADEARRLLVAPGSPMAQWPSSGSTISDAHFVRVVPGSIGGGPVPGATVEFSVIIWIAPSGSGSPWGDAGEHQLFENVVRMSDGTWRMWDSGTGP